MKRRIVSMLMAAMVGSIMLTGCGEKTESGEPTVVETPEGNTPLVEETPDVEEQPEVEEEPVEEPGNTTVSISYASIDAYYDFFDGKNKVNVDAEASAKTYGDVPEGNYDIAELKTALEEAFLVEDANISYTILTLEDENFLCVVRYASSENSGLQLNWTGVITYADGELNLVDCYTDGYRTYATLFNNGILLTGGSASAGEYIDEVCMIEPSGFIVPYRSVYSVYGTWIADDIRYQAPFPEKLDEIMLDENSPYDIAALNDTEYCVAFCSSGDDTKVVIVGYEEGVDEAADKLYATLEYLGFTMAEESIIEEYQQYGQEDCEEVVWKEL